MCWQSPFLFVDVSRFPACDTQGIAKLADFGCARRTKGAQAQVRVQGLFDVTLSQIHRFAYKPDKLIPYRLVGLVGAVSSQLRGARCFLAHLPLF